MEHIANEWLKKGLTAWKSAGAKVYFLENGKKLRIPVIKARPTNGVKQKQTILEVAGIHMEETSGINFLLNPNNFSKMRKEGKEFIIFPAVNQTGLKFPENSHEKVLRCDSSGRNYNDGWGKCDPVFKPEETYLIEEEIRKEVKKNGGIDISISLHEDSVFPGKGYIYTNGVSKPDRDKITAGIKSKVDNKLLANFTGDFNPVEATIEGGMVIVDENDPRAFEDWVFTDLRIPSVLVEGPFGCDLNTRVNFQKQVTETVLDCIQEPKK